MDNKLFKTDVETKKAIEALRNMLKKFQEASLKITTAQSL